MPLKKNEFAYEEIIVHWKMYFLYKLPIVFINEPIVTLIMNTDN